MKKRYFFIAGIVMILLILIVFRLNEDTWIKDEKGIYVKHGNPSNTPIEILEQKNIISCANELYKKAQLEGMDFNNQCLGNCSDFAVDIVNVPRDSMDNLEENQCQEYLTGELTHFIELDKDGEIVRII
ncbi:MAG: hypothetical protein OQK82_00330 [Candidatus Pacearchaeota archaeon]|nr:hypothetical protein [Candidatus Pacearchaeota archaeon]